MLVSLHPATFHSFIHSCFIITMCRGRSSTRLYYCFTRKAVLKVFIYTEYCQRIESTLNGIPARAFAESTVNGISARTFVESTFNEISARGFAESTVNGISVRAFVESRLKGISIRAFEVTWDKF